ncbi:MAG: DUF4256 domain-containing protein [Euryarchaeota archaeon]|nr:DUF4256 domain-containing protein [Euryarchaeota archaeon]
MSVSQLAKPKASTKRELPAKQQEELLRTLQARFEKNTARHKAVAWTDVKARLEGRPEKLWSLSEMERTGGEPDVVRHDRSTGEFVFQDCAPESPAGRRSLCYDRQALDARKENKPKNNAMDVAAAIGIEILTEAEYRDFQKLGAFDAKTSSWVRTPPEIRRLGGALYCDRRYEQVFTYHNGADSYYAARGFRGSLSV